MADLEAIRRGLAALLRTALPANEGAVSPWFLTDPPRISLQVAGIREMEHTDFDDGTRWLFTIEAVIGPSSDLGAQRKLDDLITAVPDAVQAGNTAAGALTSRLLDTGAVQAGQAAAADAVAFQRYNGHQRVKLDNGTEAISATWTIEVYA